MGFCGNHPLSSIQFRYRSTGRLHDLPRLNIELVVEVELKYKTPILKSVQYKAMDAFLVVIKGSLTTKSIVTSCHISFHLLTSPLPFLFLPLPSLHLPLLFSLPCLSCTHSIGFDNFSITYIHTSYTFLKTSFYSLE